MRKVAWLSLLFLGISTIAVLAQEAPVALTESAAVQLALKNQPMLRAAQAEVGMAQARVNVARAEGTVQVSANGQASVSTMRSVLAIPNVMPQALLSSQDRTSVGLNGMAMLPLYTGGRIKQAVQAAEFSAAAVKYQSAAARVQVAAEARMRYAEWRQALAMQLVAQDTLVAQTRDTTVTQQLFEAGKVPRFDLLRAQAAQAAAQQQVANAQAEVTVARARLAQALGVPADTLGKPSDEPLAAPPVDALTAALAGRPELLAAQQNIAAAEATVGARKANFKPQVYAVAMLDAIAPADMGKSLGATVGIVAGMPILDGGRRRAEVDEAQQAVMLVKASRDTIELQVRADIAAAEARITAARQNIDTATVQVAAMEEAYTVAQARYTAGKSTIVELLDAQRARTEARQNLVTAQAQYRAILAALYQAMGADIL